MKKWFNQKMAALYAAYTWQKSDVRKQLADERGDTNFISILILMAFVVLLAGAFIAFRDQIVKKVQDTVDTLNFSSGSGKDALSVMTHTGGDGALGGSTY